MRVFQLSPLGEYEFLYTEDVDQFAQIGRLDATARADNWTTVPVGIGIEDEETGAPLLRADFPWLGSWSLVLRDRAIELAGPILEPFGELLPLTCPNARVDLFNPLVVLDALDEDRSDLVRFRSGRIMAVEKHVFSPEVVPERAVFKVPQQPLGFAFYTESVVYDLEALGLAGLDFKLLWDSEAN